MEFVGNLLKDRQTKLHFGDYTSEPINISNRIRQGDPLSMILCIIYNADLLEIAQDATNETNPKEDSIGFIDNAMIIVTGKTLKSNIKMLTNIMEKAGEGFKLAKDHTHDLR